MRTLLTHIRQIGQSCRHSNQYYFPRKRPLSHLEMSPLLKSTLITELKTFNTLYQYKLSAERDRLETKNDTLAHRPSQPLLPPSYDWPGWDAHLAKYQ